MCVYRHLYTLKGKKRTKIVRNISEKEIARTYASHLNNLESIGVSCQVSAPICLQSMGWTPLSSHLYQLLAEIAHLLSLGP